MCKKTGINTVISSGSAVLLLVLSMSVFATSDTEIKSTDTAKDAVADDKAASSVNQDTAIKAESATAGSAATDDRGEGGYRFPGWPNDRAPFPSRRTRFDDRSSFAEDNNRREFSFPDWPDDRPPFPERAPWPDDRRFSDEAKDQEFARPDWSRERPPWPERRPRIEDRPERAPFARDDGREFAFPDWPDDRPPFPGRRPWPDDERNSDEGKRRDFAFPDWPERRPAFPERRPWSDDRSLDDGGKRGEFSFPEWPNDWPSDRGRRAQDSDKGVNKVDEQRAPRMPKWPESRKESIPLPPPGPYKSTALNDSPFEDRNENRDRGSERPAERFSPDVPWPNAESAPVRRPSRNGYSYTQEIGERKPYPPFNPPMHQEYGRPVTR